MRPKRRGFTLVELLVVVTIIGILLAFILRAYTGTIRVAEKSATISLIAKLETALTDRVDALTTLRADPTWAHNWLGAIWTGSGVFVPSNQRAQVIAQYDYMRAEVPDTFILELGDTDYPINFGAERFPAQPNAANSLVSLANSWVDYCLPLGAGKQIAPGVPIGPVTGMKGASFPRWPRSTSS